MQSSEIRTRKREDREVGTATSETGTTAFQPCLRRNQSTKTWITTSILGALLGVAFTAGVRAQLPNAWQINDLSAGSGSTLTYSTNAVRIWDSHTGRALTEALKHHGSVNSSRFSRNGEQLITGSDDGTVRIWDAGTGHPLSEALQHGAHVDRAYFSPTGPWILSAGGNGARLWEFPAIPDPVPDSLAGLAEATAGQRMNGHYESEPVSPAEVLDFRRDLIQRAPSDPYAR